MNTIQVDMYAVGLGAALLTQFRLDGGDVVTVLADAGMGTGYQVGGVHARFPAALTDFGNAKKRLDLIIGTHYDADHLKGLVPIAADDSIEIGEVWLPPIKDDDGEISGGPAGAHSFLAQVFYDNPGEPTLLAYLAKKKKEIEGISQTESQVVDRFAGALGVQPLQLVVPGYRALPAPQIALGAEPSVVDYERYFEAVEQDAAARTGESSHDNDTFNSLEPDAVENARKLMNTGFNAAADPFAGIAPARSPGAPAMLANVRKAAARSAITASNLQKVVEALRKRAKPIRPVCHYIAEGRPSRFVWDPLPRRFVKRLQGGPSDLELTLLGPSDALIEKHREKLPIGAYLAALAAFEEVDRESITASNQLSYILTLENKGQRLLVSGDAGCYGFRDDRKKWFPNLLKALKTLHVVQVAHHGGHNYDFYNALLASGFADQEAFSYLLLSHEVHDKTRPSKPFAHFISQVRVDEDDVQLLFTSQPTKAKVQNYKDLIAPIVPAGPSQQKGDFRLVYGGTGAGAAWTVKKHVVQV